MVARLSFFDRYDTQNTHHHPLGRPFVRTDSCLAQPQTIDTSDIVILYDNDVHGAVEGYPLMASLREQMQRLTPHVSVVSCGDFLSGSAYGSLSSGGYLVRMMNAVGYDYATLGNHEFDFGIPMLKQRTAQLEAQTICCNFSAAGQDHSIYDAFVIKHYGKRSLAFVGVTTPSTPTSSTPIYFQDSLGQWVYSFYPDKIDSLLQCRVDEVRRAGADYVVVLAHVGKDDLPDIVAHTSGIDVVLDGHSHSVIPHTILYNRLGKAVLWSSTGAYFHNIGRLVINAHGDMRSELIPCDSVEITATEVNDTLAVVRAEYDRIALRKVGECAVDLKRDMVSGQLVDCTLGNFFADAFRAVARADVGVMNRGGMRTDLPHGDLTFGDLYTAAPFNNKLCLVEMTGQALLDALEMGCRTWPRFGGGFLQVSGLTYEIIASRPTPVVTDENGLFLRVVGKRRVQNVRVWNAQSHRYELLNPKKIYRVAGTDYTLLKNGDGHVFGGVRVVDADICPYANALEMYISQFLGGRVDERYAHSEGRIRVL